MFDLSPILEVLVQFASLAGVASAIAAVVNILKSFGWVADGNAGRVSAALNLAAIVALVALKWFAPTVGVDFVDAQAALFSQIALFVLGYVMQLRVSSVANASLKGLPAVGFSYGKK